MRVRHDGAKEYLTEPLVSFYSNRGITVELTAPHSSQQNGKVERVNCTLMERVRAIISEAQVEEELWAEGLAAVVFALNWTPKRA